MRLAPATQPGEAIFIGAGAEECTVDPEGSRVQANTDKPGRQNFIGAGVSVNTVDPKGDVLHQPRHG